MMTILGLPDDVERFDYSWVKREFVCKARFGGQVNCKFWSERFSIAALREVVHCPEI